MLSRAGLNVVAVLVWTVCTLIDAASFAQQHSPDDVVRIARLVSDLGSRQYLRREQATFELQQAGKQARQQLELAARSDEPELRIRAQALLRELDLNDLWEAGRVRLPVAKANAADVVLAISEQTGNRIYLGDNYGDFADGLVELPLAGETWPLLDGICRQTGNRVRPNYGVDRDGLVIVKGAIGECPVAYSGPVRAQIISAKREFSEELEYDSNKSKVEHKFQLTLLMMWEERFRPVAARANLELVEASISGDQGLKSVQASSTQWNVFDSSSRQFTTAIKLQPPSANASAINSMVLLWDVIAIGQIARLEIVDFTLNKRHRQEDALVMIHNLEHLEGPRWEIELSVARDLPIPEPEEVLYRENSFELIDHEGNLMRPNGQSGHAKEFGVARHKLIFRGDTEDSRPAKLIIHYPRLRDRRQVRIEFSDVPLPVAKPE